MASDVSHKLRGGARTKVSVGTSTRRILHPARREAVVLAFGLRSPLLQHGPLARSTEHPEDSYWGV